jgi:SAM-dependent methyltransferase
LRSRSNVPRGVGIRPGRAERLPFRDDWFDRVTMSLVVHLLDRPAAFAEVRRVVSDDGRLAVATFHPDHFATYWLNPFFPSIRVIDEARFPTPAALEAELAEAGFARVTLKRLTAVAPIDRITALERIRGRHISTFDLIPPDEIAEGLAHAERELPEVVETRLDQLLLVAHAA